MLDSSVDPYESSHWGIPHSLRLLDICWIHVRSFHLLSFTSYHLGHVPFLIEFIIPVSPSFWVHFSCFGYRSYSFVLIFVSSVLGCKPHVSFSFSFLDYHSFFEHHLRHTPILKSFRSSFLVSWSPSSWSSFNGLTWSRRFWSPLLGIQCPSSWVVHDIHSPELFIASTA